MYADCQVAHLVSKSFDFASSKGLFEYRRKSLLGEDLARIASLDLSQRGSAALKSNAKTVF